jgi:hypothetical protein
MPYLTITTVLLSLSDVILPLWESIGDFLIHFSLVANRVNHVIIVNADGSFAIPLS